MKRQPWTDADTARAKELRATSKDRPLTEEERSELSALRHREVHEAFAIRRRLSQPRGAR